LAAANDFVQPGRDQEFIDLLVAFRGVGSKSSEPPVYENYGDYLLGLGRTAEALPIYREALRQVEGFGWRAQVPRYRLAVIAALVRMGDLAAAEVEWAALNRIVAATPDLPAERALEVRVAWVKWLVQRGRDAAARLALREAQDFAGAQKLNAWQRRELDGLDLGAPMLTAEQTQAPAELVTLQPLKIETGVIAGDPLRARFALRNPASTAHAGTLIARGPAARLHVAENPRRVVGTGVVGGAMAELRLPLVVFGGEELPIVLEIEGGTRPGAAELAWNLAWKEDAAPSAQNAEWKIRAEAEPFVTSVLNANQLRRNPFYAVSFTHQIVHRDPGAALENIRLIASEPLRLECYDAVTGRLLAVDAEGNGDFGDAGDILLDDADANRALDLPFAAGQRLREVEVFVFMAVGSSQATVDVELLTATGWEKCARNELGKE
jgi:hypothetical protein